MFHNPTKMFDSPHALTSRAVWHVTDKGWSSDFPPLPDAFSPKRTMALLSGSHNGVHCCGTVGDSHPVHYVDLFSPQQSASKLAFAFGLRKRSQLSTAKCTFTGDSFQNHDARTGNPFSQFHGKGTKKYAKSKRKSNFSARHERFSHGGNDLFPGCGFSATKVRIQFEIVQSETGIIFAIRVFPMCWSR